MPRKTNDEYDGFRLMLKEIARFNDQYRSFTTGKTYVDLLGKTATGLLKDVAAKTEELSEQDRKQHKYSLEVFAAFCMYFCIKEITSRFRGNDVDFTSAGVVVNPVYVRVLNRIKSDLETKGECLFVRNLIRCSARNAMFDQIEINNRYVELDDGSSDDTDEDLKSISKAVRIVLVDGTADAIAQHERLTTTIKALAQAGKEGILSKKELYAICHFYGVGDGFKKLSNHEIAVKFKCSDPQASKLRDNGIKKMYRYIKDTSEFREMFF